MKVFNTLTDGKEDFIPHKDKEVTMYVCGPTTYNYIHLGNARPMVVFDTIRRFLEYIGYKVTYVQNFTDIDDKIIDRAAEKGQDPFKLAEKYIDEYFHDAEKLKVKMADFHPRVTQNMNEIIEMVQNLIANGCAYEVSGDVYFDVSSFKTYGKLSGRSLDDLKCGARVEIDAKKNNPLDFAVWKASKEGEPGWESPWGRGRPGWHIECSAMSIKYLGTEIDIHGGGYDLVFPHHENEIAQAEACTRKPFVRYWIHNGFITVNEEKMSKSLGNFFLVREILKKFPGEVVRFFLLSTHYRSPIDFDDQKLNTCAKGLDRIKNTFASLEEALAQGNFENNDEESNTADLREFKQAIEAAGDKFINAMKDDFNTALAIAAIFDFCKDVNTFLHNGIKGIAKEKKHLEKARDLFIDLCEDVLGILFSDDQGSSAGDSYGLVNDLMELLLEIRERARENKDWGTADTIRDGLVEMGIEIKDTPQGPKWDLH
ncbi:MAG: cysteine--tRNA ligase [Clostridia bacterium]|nr:cysteine--tRNA ligase [Clostridia bacterium]